MEKKSTQSVVVLFCFILLIHVVNPAGMWKVDAIRYLWVLCMILILGFILAEFLKDLFFPLIAKVVFKEKSK
jgi:hypothetical protein